jgi:hypothetical protein
MVQFTKSALVAALLVAPAIAAPLSQGAEAEQEFTREFEETEVRDFDKGLDLEARAGGRGFALGASTFAAMIAARPLGESLATIFKRPKNPTFKRSFEDEDEIFERDYDEELELFEREFEDALEQRSPVQAQTLLKIGTFLGKKARWLIPLGGATGVGIG